MKFSSLVSSEYANLYSRADGSLWTATIVNSYSGQRIFLHTIWLPNCSSTAGILDKSRSPNFMSLSIGGTKVLDQPFLTPQRLTSTRNVSIVQSKISSSDRSPQRRSFNNPNQEFLLLSQLGCNKTRFSLITRTRNKRMPVRIASQSHKEAHAL